MSFSGPTFEQALQAAASDQLRSAPGNLREAIQYSLLAPGKRIRPRIAAAAGELLGLSPEVCVRVGISLEMVHCFSLIHDDLPCLDDDDFRRGRASNHKVHGEAIALLAGDALAFQAAAALLSLCSSLPAERVTSGALRLLRLAGPEGMIGGQAAEALLTEKSALDEVRAMQALKTGALFEAAVMIPADLAGVDEATGRGQSLRSFALALGWAFQVADDLADGAQDGGRQEVNVLSRLSPAEARRLAREELARGCQALQSHWPGTAGPLDVLAEEVARLLDPTEGGK